MKTSSVMLFIAAVAAIVSLSAAGLTYYSISQFKETWITGYAGNLAFINLTVEAATQINFTDDSINWGSGRVLSGPNVTLNTAGPVNVTSNGNWTNETTGLTLENIGNLNVSLNLSVGKTAAQFLGGTFPVYQWNVSNIEARSCLNSTGGIDALDLNNFNSTTTSHYLFCPRLRFADTNDSIRIDVRLVVPSDSLTGALSDVVTATAWCAGASISC